MKRMSTGCRGVSSVCKLNPRGIIWLDLGAEIMATLTTFGRRLNPQRIVLRCHFDKLFVKAAAEQTYLQGCASMYLNLKLLCNLCSIPPFISNLPRLDPRLAITYDNAS